MSSKLFVLHLSRRDRQNDKAEMEPVIYRENDGLWWAEKKEHRKERKSIGWKERAVIGWKERAFAANHSPSFFLYITGSISAMSFWRSLLDKCETKSVEDMSTLLKAVLKFCTTNLAFCWKPVLNVFTTDSWNDIAFKTLLSHCLLFVSPITCS